MIFLRLVREACHNVYAYWARSLIGCIVCGLVVALVVVVYGQIEVQRRGLELQAQSPGIRTLTVSGDGFDNYTWQSVQLLSLWSGSSVVWAAGGASDVRNANFPAAAPVTMRSIESDWQTLPLKIVSGRLPNDSSEAIVDVESAKTLQLGPSGGSISDVDGSTLAIVGRYTRLHERSPRGVIHPLSKDSFQSTRVQSISITVVKTSDITLAEQFIVNLGKSPEGKRLSVDQAAEAASLGKTITRSVVKTSGRVLFTVCTVAAALLALMSFFTSYLRAGEFGRRRALGARRSDVVILVVFESMVGAGVGVLAGLVFGGASVKFLMSGSIEFAFGAKVAVTVLSSATLLNVPSAVVSSLRDPVRVLRSP